MRQYIDAVKHVINNGKFTENRTDVNTLSVFGYQMRFNLQDGFPATTTKELKWKSVVSELLWFLEGSTNERRLAEIRYGKPRAELEDKKTIWTPNYKKQACELGYVDGELGPIYGKQWRDFGGVDQIKSIVNSLRYNPSSRRIILSSWNPRELDNMSLPPCHVMAQFDVSDGKLSCQMYQRSVDVGLGLPFNIASYALLTHLLARESGLGVGDFIHVSGNMHIYDNHIEYMKAQINQNPKKLPTININPDFVFPKEFGDKVGYDDVNKIVLENYEFCDGNKLPPMKMVA